LNDSFVLQRLLKPLYDLFREISSTLCVLNDGFSIVLEGFFVYCRDVVLLALLAFFLYMHDFGEVGIIVDYVFNIWQIVSVLNALVVICVEV
jgi:hypothetical protein